MSKKLLISVLAGLFALALMVMLIAVVQPMLAAGFVGLLLLSLVTTRSRNSGEARAGPGGWNLHNEHGENNFGGGGQPFTAASKEVYDGQATSLSLGPRVKARLHGFVDGWYRLMHVTAARLSSLMRSARFIITTAGRSHLGHGYVRERESAAYGCA